MPSWSSSSSSCAILALPTPAIDLGLLARRDGQLDGFGSGAAARDRSSTPTNAVAWSELGVTLRQEGKFTEARRPPTSMRSPPMTDYAPRIAISVCCWICIWAIRRRRCRSSSATRHSPREDKPVSTWIAELRTAHRRQAAAPAAEAPATRIRHD